MALAKLSTRKVNATLTIMRKRESVPVLSLHEMNTVLWVGVKDSASVRACVHAFVDQIASWLSFLGAIHLLLRLELSLAWNSPRRLDWLEGWPVAVPLGLT